MQSTSEVFAELREIAVLLEFSGAPKFKVKALVAFGTIVSTIDCDVPAVLDALCRSRGAIELNSDLHRLDLPPAWIPAARERDLPFVISVEAHSTLGFDVLRYGAIMARRGGLRRQDVLNTQSTERFIQPVRPTGAVA